MKVYSEGIAWDSVEHGLTRVDDPADAEVNLVRPCPRTAPTPFAPTCHARTKVGVTGNINGTDLPTWHVPQRQ
jgi:hypothetical protein